jgi:hypothetical protein
MRKSRLEKEFKQKFNEIQSLGVQLSHFKIHEMNDNFNEIENVVKKTNKSKIIQPLWFHKPIMKFL